MYCAPKRKGATRIDCFLARQNHHKGDGDQLCLAENVQVNFRDLADGKTPRAYFKRYVESRHQQQHSKVAYSKGTLRGSCDPAPGLWQAKSFPGWNVNWFRAFEAVDEVQCDVRESAPTLIVERDTFANFFHNSEDFFNTLIALAVLEWPLDNLQILLTDLYPQGPFWPMWANVFFGGRDPLAAWDVAQKYGAKNVCFDKAAIAILAPQSSAYYSTPGPHNRLGAESVGAAAPITVASWNTPCSSSTIVRAYSDFVVAGLGLAQETRYHPTPRDPRDVTVTFMARRSASEWPEKRFCDSDKSFFDCSMLQHLGVRKLGRSVRNDDDLVAQLRAALEKKTYFNSARVTVKDVDYSELSFVDQIRTDLETDIMVGPHGAGLMHNIFMTDRAQLIELHIDGSSANRHFHNLARWQGRKYTGKPMSNPIPAAQLIGMITNAVESIDTTKPY